MNDDDDLDPKKRKLTRAGIARLLVAAVLVLATAGFFIYTRLILVKSPLGGPCTWAMHCRAEAPKCLKQAIEGGGVCSRPCNPGTDCADGIRCMKVELEERDDRGVPLEGGYCFPQAMLDAKKPRPAVRDAGASGDSWIDIPEAAAQFEGEVVFRQERGNLPPGDPKTFPPSGVSETRYMIKGTLLRPVKPTEKTRTIVDTSTLRMYVVDDDKRTFTGSALDPAAGEARVTKTAKKDHVEGRECDVWTIEDGKAMREACIMQGAAFVDPSWRGVFPWARELAVRGAFPLRVIERDADGGREASRFIAVHVEARPMDPTLFTIPKSYKNLVAR